MFSKDDDHMAQIIELLGDFELSLKMGGSNSLLLFELDGTFVRGLSTSSSITNGDTRYTALYFNVEALAVEMCHEGEIPILGRGCDSSL